MSNNYNKTIEAISFGSAGLLAIIAGSLIFIGSNLTENFDKLFLGFDAQLISVILTNVGLTVIIFSFIYFGFLQQIIEFIKKN